jgi:transposase
LGGQLLFYMAAWKQKRRDPLTLEERRINGIKMIVEQGLSEHEVARRLGVTQSVVSQWYSAYRDGGNSYDALKSTKHTGRPSKLNRRQLAVSIPKILEEGAQHYGFFTDLWTAERLAKVIEEKYGIQYSSSQVARILGSMNLSYQKPEGKAREYDEKKVRDWVRNTLPDIKKVARD